MFRNLRIFIYFFLSSLVMANNRLKGFTSTGWFDDKNVQEEHLRKESKEEIRVRSHTRNGNV